MKKKVFILSAALSLWACAGPEENFSGLRDGEILPVRIELRGATRSSLPVPDDFVGRIALFFYEDGSLAPGLTVEETAATGSLEAVTVPLVIGHTYQILAIANCAAPDMPESLAEAGEMCYSCSGFGEWTDGIPMSGQALVTVLPDTPSVGVVLTRLAARLDLTIDASRLRHGSVAFSSAKVLQMNRVCPFWGTGAATAAGGVCDGDLASSSDFADLSAGQVSIPFYLLENMQGDLLPDNDDPSLKTPAAIRAAGADSTLCTYLQLEGVYTDRSGHLKGEPLVARFYLGGDATRNFDISRNSRYAVTLQLTDEGCLRSDWKVESTVNDSRVLRFARLSYTVIAPETGSVALNTNLSLEDGDFYYTVKDNLNDFTFTPGASGFQIKPRENLEYSRVTTVTATTWDGAISTSCLITGKPDPSRLIRIDWAGDMYVAQKKLLTLTDPSGASLAGRVVILPDSNCVSVEGADGTWYVSGQYPGFDTLDLILDGELVAHILVNVLPVVFRFPSDKIMLPLDGSEVEAGPYLYTPEGVRMYYEDFDSGLYAAKFGFTLERYCMGDYAGASWPKSSTAGNAAVESRKMCLAYPCYAFRLAKQVVSGVDIHSNYDFSAGEVPIERITARATYSMSGAGSCTAELCVSD